MVRELCGERANGNVIHCSISFFVEKAHIGRLNEKYMAMFVFVFLELYNVLQYNFKSSFYKRANVIISISDCNGYYTTQHLEFHFKPQFKKTLRNYCLFVLFNNI